MSSSDNTLFLRLAGPMQSWGTSSRFQLRRSDPHPSKSSVLGIILCSMGIRREDSDAALAPLRDLRMGVRVDRPGISDWDYQTAGAGIVKGMRSAEGKIKKTGTTGEHETLLSRRQYLYDASFLVVLQGSPETISSCTEALEEPEWPVFLGRKCCIPAEPIFTKTGYFSDPKEALSSVPWQPRDRSIDLRNNNDKEIELEIIVEHPSGSEAPSGAELVYDVPRKYGFYGYTSRWVSRENVTVLIGEPIHPQSSHNTDRGWTDYGSSQWRKARLSRLKLDNYLCVFCKSPAKEVHHVDYKNAGKETDADLRSLCKLCHDACTILEYDQDMKQKRIDPSDPAQRELLLCQIKRIMDERQQGHRGKLLEAGRNIIRSKAFNDMNISTGEDQ